MSQKQQQEQEQQFRIPQTIQNHKLDILKWKVLSTITGVDFVYVEYRHFISWLILFAAFVIVKFVPQVPYGAAIGVCSGVCFLATFINKIIDRFFINQPNNNSNLKLQLILYNLLISAIYGWVWSHQLFHAGNEPSIIILSLISIATSINTICVKPIQQLSSPSLYIAQPHIQSTLYIRLLLPLPLFIVQLILDFGQFLSPQTNHLFYIRLSLSLVFLTWTLGWISSLYNVYYFLINNINKFIFGDESKHCLSVAFLSLVLNCIPIAIFYGFAQEQSVPVWILWVGSSLTSVVNYLLVSNFFMAYLSPNQQKQQNNSQTTFSNQNNHLKNIKRTIFAIFAQLIICSALVAVLLTCDFVEEPQQLSSKSIKIITIINTCLFVFFKFITFLALPRNSLGLAINFIQLNSHYLRALQRIVLRISSGLTVIIMVQNLSKHQLWMKLDQTVNFSVDLKFVQYFFLPFIVYRSYKRTLSQSTTFSLHLSILIALGFVHQEYPLQGILTVLFFPPFPQNFIMTCIAPFTTPKKLMHKTQLPYQLIYLLVSSIAWISHLLSIGMLEFTMVFGLPMFWCVLPSFNEANKVKSKQHSLYQKIVTYIPNDLLRYKPQGFYLLRISKYILLVELKSTNYGFAEAIDIKGLQVQQVTSCHSKQGDTIDKLVEQTWGDNKQFFSASHLSTVLSPEAKSVIYVPTQNQIQLTGIIESKQFVQLFKKATIRALCFIVSTIKYTQNQLSQGQEIISELSPICKQQKFQSTFPSQFAKQISLEIQYPSFGTNSVQVKKKLPPIKNKNSIVNDFMDLLDNSPKVNTQIKAETSTHFLNTQIKNETSNNAHQLNEQGSQKNIRNKIQENTSKINIKHLNASLIMTLYHYSVGKFDYFNIRKVYDLIKMQKGEMSQVKFQQSQKIVSQALSMGLKIAIDKITMGEEDVTADDFQQYQKNAYIGIAGSQGYNNAVSKDLSDIWTLNYSKGKLSVKRLSKSENQLYMFGADSTIVKSVWNNLRFQLMYATNDNDERYSIQTHPYLLRNLWTEACQEPFGYPSFHLGVALNQ